MVSRVGERSRVVSVVVDDPAGLAHVLQEQMDPADLVELVVILAQAMAEVLRQRHHMRVKAVRYSAPRCCQAM